MGEVQILRNALGVMHKLYNSIKESTKRHSIFQEPLNLADYKNSITLKSLSITRWACR